METAAPADTTETTAVDFQAAVLPEWMADHVLPKGVEVSHITQTSAVIEWPASLAPGISRFRVEVRQLQNTPDRTLEVSWFPLTDVPIQSRGTAFAALLTDLPPGQPFTVRIVPLQANGEAGERLFALDFFTPPKSSLLAGVTRHSLTSWLIGVLVTLVVWKVVRRWRPRGAS